MGKSQQPFGFAQGRTLARGTVTDTYDMDTFGKPIATTGSTPNPYRFGAAWGYITDPNGFLQLGAALLSLGPRCGPGRRPCGPSRWPEIGRFVSQDKDKEGINWYIYVEGARTRRDAYENLRRCYQ